MWWRAKGKAAWAVGAVVLLVAAGVAIWVRAEEEKAPSVTGIVGRGMVLPFHEVEAEHGDTDGTVIGPGREIGSLAGEASGRMAVTLAPGERVSFRLGAVANAVSVRYSIADSADGAGQDAELKVSTKDGRLPSLGLTSRYSWFYGGFPFPNRPALGGARHRYDTVRVLLGRELSAGDEVALTATVPTTMDLADFEQVAPVMAAPPGALSVLDFGADPTGERESGAGFADAVASAGTQGKVLFIPAGRYRVSRHLEVDRVTIQGAGMWHTELRGSGVGIYGGKASTGVRLSDFAVGGRAGRLRRRLWSRSSQHNLG